MSFNETSKNLADASAAYQAHLSKSQADQAKRAELVEIIAELEVGLREAAQSQSKRDKYARDTQRFELLRKDSEQLNARLEQLDILEEELSKLTQAMSDLPVVGRRDVESFAAGRRGSSAI